MPRALPPAPVSPLLRCPGWAPSVRARLEELILAGAGRGLPVAFDFDNTLVCGDIGEATLAVLARDGRVTPNSVAPSLAPDFRSADGAWIRLRDLPDIAAYYEALLGPTVHRVEDPQPLATGYVWAAEIMEGLRVSEVIAATRAAYALSAPGEERGIEASPGGLSYPAPFFYPEMLELVAALLRHDFDVWVVSASNVWTVRWMVLKGLNPELERHGAARGIAPDHVVGVSTLLRDARGHLLKDRLLVRESPEYAALEEGVAASLVLTSRLEFPVPIYAGKVACLGLCSKEPPYLAAGDSPGDLPMLAHSTHRLWVARLDKAAYQRALQRQIETAVNPGRWLVQPARTRGQPGLVGVEPAPQDDPGAL